MNGNELDLLCSLNLRKWSDRYGDWSFADAAAIDECAIRSFMADRQLPPHTITLFLHEVTHHLLTQPDLVQRFVELSAYSSIFPGRRFLTAQFAQDGIDLKDVLAALDRCRKSSGFVFYVEGSDDSIRTLA